MDKTTGEPLPRRGALRSQVAVLGDYSSYNGVIPPSWANGSPRGKKLQMEMPVDSDSERGYCEGAASGSDNERQFVFGF